MIDRSPPKRSLPDLIQPDNRFKYKVPVETFIEYFNVTNDEVKGALIRYPTLCYLLGNVTDQPQGEDLRPDGIQRKIYYLTEGSAMFNLEKPDDAMRWKGIFNHIVGSARQVYWLATKLKKITSEQKQRFAELGFDFSFFDQINPELLRNFMFTSHAGRRITDETDWHKLENEPHGEIDSGKATAELLKKLKADPVYLELMRVEMHADHLTQAGKNNFFPNIIDNILTYCDWTFGQKPNTLEERFTALEKSKRASPEVLAILKECGLSFELALKQVLGENIWQEMTSAGPYEWETEIRQAYCAPSGLSLQEVFPGYLEQFPQVKQ